MYIEKKNIKIKFYWLGLCLSHSDGSQKSQTERGQHCENSKKGKGRESGSKLLSLNVHIKYESTLLKSSFLFSTALHSTYLTHNSIH